MIDIKKLIEYRIMDDAEQIKRGKEDIESFHASSVSSCARQLFLTKIHAKTFDISIKSKMQIGSAIHSHIQAYQEIRDVFDVEVPVRYQIEGSPAYIIGSADLVAKDKSLLLDIKSIAGLSFVITKAIPEHLVQLNVYMKCLNINDGQILYVAKTDMQMVTHNWKYNEIVFEETCRKIISVYEALKIWENAGAFNNPIPFEKCKHYCFGCDTEQIKPEFKRL